MTREESSRLFNNTSVDLGDIVLSVFWVEAESIRNLLILVSILIS